MLDFGWAELFVVMAVAVFAIGPQEIPGLMRGVGQLFRRFRYMKHAVSRQFEEILADTEITDVNFEALNHIERAPDGADFNEALHDRDEDEDQNDEDVMVPLSKIEVSDE